MRCDYPNDPTSSIPHPINRQHLLASSSPATITTLSPSSSSRSGSPCNSSSSSGALSSPQVSAQPSRDRSMEDVWREIALCPTPSLDNPRCNNYMHQQPQPAPHHPVTAPLMTLEDFLRGAPSATGALAAPPMTVPPLGQIHNKAVPPSIGVIVPRPPPPAPVAVPLSPSFDFGFAVDVANADTHQPTTKPRDHQNLQQKNGRPPASPFAIGSPATPFSGTNIGSSPLSAFLPLGSQRRIPEQPLLPPAQTQPAGAVAGSGYVIEGGERRRKRMIKNRESAARSRARKQAYTNELEVEVSRLLQENADLQRQQDKLRLALATQPSGKKTLQRTSTAPF